MSCGRLSRAPAASTARFDAARKGANAVFVQPLRMTSLTQQRREVLSHAAGLESLRREPNSPHWELIPSPKKREINEVSIHIKTIYENNDGTPLVPQDESMIIENTGPPVCERIALTS